MWSMFREIRLGELGPFRQSHTSELEIFIVKTRGHQYVPEINIAICTRNKYCKNFHQTLVRLIYNHFELETKLKDSVKHMRNLLQ